MPDLPFPKVREHPFRDAQGKKQPHGACRRERGDYAAGIRHKQKVYEANGIPTSSDVINSTAEAPTCQSLWIAFWQAPTATGDVATTTMRSYPASQSFLRLAPMFDFPVSTSMAMRSFWLMIIFTICG